jgi:hypothetical protein
MLRVNSQVVGNTWSYFAGTWDGTNQLVYKNGIQVGSSVPGGTLDSITTTGVVSSSAEQLNGFLPVVEVYNRVLTAAELYQNYIALAPRFDLEVNNSPKLIFNPQISSGSLNGGSANQTFSDIIETSGGATLGSSATYGKLNTITPSGGLIISSDDSYFSNVSLLLDGESLTDKSQNAVTVTVEGSVIVDSSFKKVGNSSLKFGGALSDGLSVPSSSLFAFPGDFTIEFWTYANQWGQRSGATVYFCNGVLNQFQLAVYPATQIELYLNGSSFINVPLSASIVGRWVHIAIVRSGSTIRIYENGNSVGSGVSSYRVPASTCYIGKQLPRSPINYGHNLDGYIDEFRIIFKSQGIIQKVVKIESQ